jgi:hypothetical protein
MATKIAKEQVWKELDPNNPKAKVKLVGADDHKPDKTYVLVARKGQKIPEHTLEGFDGVGKFFGGAIEADPDAKEVVISEPEAGPKGDGKGKPARAARKTRSTRVSRRATK